MAFALLSLRLPPSIYSTSSTIHLSRVLLSCSSSRKTEYMSSAKGYKQKFKQHLQSNQSPTATSSSSSSFVSETTRLLSPVRAMLLDSFFYMHTHGIPCTIESQPDERSLTLLLRAQTNLQTGTDRPLLCSLLRHLTILSLHRDQD